jgi:hypothetical protein
MLTEGPWLLRKCMALWPKFEMKKLFGMPVGLIIATKLIKILHEEAIKCTSKLAQICRKFKQMAL